MIIYPIALAAVLLVLAFAAWAFLPAKYLPGNRARHFRIRLHLRLHPGKGFATVFALHLRWGRVAAWRRSGRVRPSLPWWVRALVPWTHSAFLGRAHYRHGLRVPLEEHLLVVAPPRTFKTAFLSDAILRHPGPVLATTTKADVYALTSAVRAEWGPLHVFNPQRIGGVASTFRWSPVAGCEDPATAIRRADAFAQAVSQKGVEDATFWSAKASDYLRAYFHAAALTGQDLRAVAAWVAGVNPAEPEQILLAAGADSWAFSLAELTSEAQKTAATVRMVMVKVFLPGITDVTTLDAASKLCGQAAWKIRGHYHATWHDIATPDMIRQLPAGFALVIRGGYAPVIARLPRAWNNPAYKRARRIALVSAARDIPRRDPPPELPPACRPVVEIPDHVPDDLITGWDEGFPWN